jgi:hypothetical protein
MQGGSSVVALNSFGRLGSFIPKIALEGGDKEFYQEIRKTGMEGTWQAGRD